MANFKRILLAADFSETSACAVEHAVLMAKTFDAALHVLHVVENEVPAMMDGLSYLPANFFEEIEKQAAEQLEQVISREDRDKLSVTLVMRRGASFLEIIRYAREQKMDLIVLGTHGRGALAHVLLGSVAEKVVRKAPCAVLTVRHPKHEFVMP
ncbi:MAG: putative universal stress protein [Planctomycetaceae bacterium]|nr:putative universal stress protein [Planctomycetaceae bacterium]